MPEERSVVRHEKRKQAMQDMLPETNIDKQVQVQNDACGKKGRKLEHLTKKRKTNH
jgi:hypothetical protein